MKQRIYIDTSVIGGCFDKEFQEWSNKLFDDFRKGNKIAVISDITLDELSFSRPEVRNHLNTIPDAFKEYILNDEQSEELADQYIKERAVTQKSHEDALHIAVGAHQKIPYLLTWNLRHMANATMRPLIETVCADKGYKAPIICTPEELRRVKP